MGKKRRKKAKKGPARAKVPSLADAMKAIQAEKAKGTKDDVRWHLLASAEGTLRKLRA